MTQPPVHVHLAETPSTMEAARELAGPEDFRMVTAEAQTSGRGTRGRPWHSPKGNLYLTLAIHRRRLPPERFALLPLEAGIALWDAASTFVPPSARSGLRLKWPNDLLWEGRKAAGMLLEASADHVFVGVGVNLAEAPPIADGGTPSACLTEAGVPEDCGLPLAKAFFAGLQARLLEASPQDTVEAWRARAQWNRPLRLRDRPGRPEVTPVDVNGEGHLLVRFTDGREEWLISEYLA